MQDIITKEFSISIIIHITKKKKKKQIDMDRYDRYKQFLSLKD